MLFVIQIFCIGKTTTRPIHATMGVPPFDGVRGFAPFTLNPLQISESRTVLIFINHPCRQERKIAREFRERQRKFPLGSAVRCGYLAHLMRHSESGSLMAVMMHSKSTYRSLKHQLRSAQNRISLTEFEATRFVAGIYPRPRGPIA